MISVHSLWALPLTIGVFWGMRTLSQKYHHAVLNPLLLSLTVIVPFLMIFSIDYADYFVGAKPLHEILQLGVIALAFPLYKQLPYILRRWKAMLTVCSVSSLMAMVSGVAMVWVFEPSVELAASVLPKSVTTPIALAVTEQAGGIAAIAALCVIYAGILGAIVGHWILDILKIQSKSARGMAIGACAHVIGTARCHDVDLEESAFSSLALVLCGIITALSANVLFNMMMKIVHQ